MSRFTDSLENEVTYGTLSILPGNDPSNGSGDLEVYNNIYTDTILANTPVIIGGIGINLENVQFLDKTFTMTPTTQPVSVTNNTFYIDTLDQLLKSVDPLNVVTVYQPTNAKGDITVHDGTTQVRLPVGLSNQILTVDPTTATSLKWVNTINSSSIMYDIITLSTNKNVTGLEYPIGSFFLSVYPLIEKGPSNNILVSKSIVTNGGNIAILNANNSLTSNKAITVTYPAYNGVLLMNKATESDGSYKILNSLTFINETITLTNTATTVYLPSITSGCYYLNISTLIGGPCANYLICKADPALNSMVFSKITSSPGVSPTTNLVITWPSGSGLTIAKDTSSFNGDYTITDNFQYQSSISVTLTNTSTTTIPFSIFPYYTCKSFYVKVQSLVTQSPCAIFTVSKNSPGLVGNIFRVSAPGTTTLEQLNLVWGINSLLQLSKTGNNYNGLYTLTFTKLV